MIRKKGDDRNGHFSSNRRRCAPDSQTRRRHGQHPGADPAHGRGARQRDNGRPGRGRLRRRQPAQRLPRAHARHQRGNDKPAHSQAAPRQLLPRGPHRTLLAGRPGGHRRSIRDGDLRRVHEEGGARGGVAGYRPHERLAGLPHMRVTGRYHGRSAGEGPVRRLLSPHLGRRHLYQVPRRRARVVMRARHRYRRRLRWVPATARARCHRYRELRRLAGIPAIAARAGRERRALRHLRRPRGA